MPLIASLRKSAAVFATRQGQVRGLTGRLQRLIRFCVRNTGPASLALGALLALAAAAPAAMPAPVATDTQLTAAGYQALRAVDVRMATIAFRLATANAALCDRRAPVPGLAIHALGQYPPEARGAARRVFGFEAPVAVEGVVAGSPAAAAGIRADDAIVAIDGVVLDAAPGPGTSSQGRDRAAGAIAAHPADAPLHLRLLRNGRLRDVAVPASPGCRSDFEVTLDPAMAAQADGRVVQIGVGFFERYGDGEAAAAVAHELAHNILDHHARLNAAGIHHGLFEDVGRNGRLIRRAEDEADQLSVGLLYNAGYNPLAAVRLWQEHGRELDGGLLRSRTHASPAARARRIEAEVARIPAGSPSPFVPDVLATRFQPME